MAKQAKVGKRRDWKYGYARFNGKGWVYCIRKRLGGVQWERSTGVVDDESLANHHFEVFQRQPAAYDPRTVFLGRGPLFLDDALLIKFLDWQAAPEKNGGRGNSPGHLNHRKNYLIRISLIEIQAARAAPRRSLRAAGAARPLVIYEPASTF